MTVKMPLSHPVRSADKPFLSENTVYTTGKIIFAFVKMAFPLFK